MEEREITERLVKRGEAEKDFDREFWRKAGHEARFAAAWQMVIEAALFRGQDAGELRLQRTVECFKRRGS
ncbi:hypothetical protein HZA57_02230 [Candidatus Poribacteria bacterium]|nr:hypothetical protein [Candidatus Poribacteria bacterium]